MKSAAQKVSSVQKVFFFFKLFRSQYNGKEGFTIKDFTFSSKTRFPGNPHENLINFQTDNKFWSLKRRKLDEPHKENPCLTFSNKILSTVLNKFLSVSWSPH